MEDIKSIVAENIASLRQAHGMTQLELAEKLNYSDKTISKWERAESSPDISVLAEMAALFGVPLMLFGLGMIAAGVFIVVKGKKYATE